MEYSKEAVAGFSDDQLQAEWEKYLAYSYERQRLRGLVQSVLRKKSPQRRVKADEIVEGGLAVLATASHPYAGLLWLEFMAGPQGQAIIDEYEPVSASVYAPGSVLEKIVRGKKVWIRDLTTIDQTSKWMKMALEAFGFPREERAKAK